MKKKKTVFKVILAVTGALGIGIAAYFGYRHAKQKKEDTDAPPPLPPAGGQASSGSSSFMPSVPSAAFPLQKGKKGQEVRTFQSLLATILININPDPLGKYGADGDWGTTTDTAYKSVVNVFNSNLALKTVAQSAGLTSLLTFGPIDESQYSKLRIFYEGIKSGSAGSALKQYYQKAVIKYSNLAGIEDGEKLLRTIRSTIAIAPYGNVKVEAGVLIGRLVSMDGNDLVFEDKNGRIGLVNSDDVEPFSQFS